MENMTIITRRMHDNAMQMKTIAQARELLANCQQFRSLGDILKAFAECDDPREKIVNAILAFDPSKRRDSTDKKVRNWFNGTTNSLEKKDVYYLSRAMNFTLEQTDAILKYITSEGIHWRSPVEIIWCYAIANKLDYPNTFRLLQRVEKLGKKKTIEPEPVAGSYTDDIKLNILPLLNQPEEALLDYLSRSQHLLGACHNTAYDLFMKYNQILEGTDQPEKIKRDGKVSARYILEKYLFRCLIPTSKRKKSEDSQSFNAVQRAIRQNWPDETTYSRMKSRELDIPRKVMILLFLAVDDGEPEEKEPDQYDYEEFDMFADEMYPEKPLTRDERFEMLKKRVNRMLINCGFQVLDPRSPLDWIILFCMCTEDMIELDKRLEGVLTALFPEGNQTQEHP